SGALMTRRSSWASGVDTVREYAMAAQHLDEPDEEPRVREQETIDAPNQRDWSTELAHQAPEYARCEEQDEADGGDPLHAHLDHDECRDRHQQQGDRAQPAQELVRPQCQRIAWATQRVQQRRNDPGSRPVADRHANAGLELADILVL